MTRVLIIEDEFIIASFIEQQLKTHFDCDPAIAVSATEAREIMPRLLPQLVLCDINLQTSQSGVQLIQEFQQHYAFEVIYITSYQSKSMIEYAIASGAAAYIIKPVDEMQLFAGVRLVMKKISDQAIKAGRVDIALTDNERRITQLVSLRKSSREIAEILHLSPHTVKNQRHKICQKLGLPDENNALLKWALEHAEQLR